MIRDDPPFVRLGSARDSDEEPNGDEDLIDSFTLDHDADGDKASLCMAQAIRQLQVAKGQDEDLEEGFHYSDSTCHTAAFAAIAYTGIAFVSTLRDFLQEARKESLK